MNSVRVGWGFYWNAYASALARQIDAFLAYEERRKPSGGVVEAVWTLPPGREAGPLVELKLIAGGAGGAERTTSLSIATLGDERAAASLAHRLWDDLLSAAGRPDEVSDLPRWRDDGGR